MAINPSGVPTGDLYLGAPIGSKPTLNASAYNPTSGIDTKVGSQTYGQLINQNKTGQPPTPAVKSAPAVITPEVAKNDLGSAKQTLDKTTLDMQAQQQANAQKDAQTKEDVRIAGEQKDKEGDQTDVTKLTDAANSLSMKSDGELTQMLTGGDPTKGYYTMNGQVIDTNTGSSIGSIDDVRAGKITAESLGNVKKTSGTDQATTLIGGKTPEQIQQEVMQDTADVAKSHQNMIDTITGIQNGTIPLTPDQQSQLDYTKQIFEQARQKLMDANQFATGRLQEMQAVTGAGKYAQESSLGIVQESINRGAQKIADLGAKQAQALSKLRLSFTTSNIKLAQDSFKEYQDLVTKKDTELNKLVDEARKYQDSANKLSKYTVANLDKLAKSGMDVSDKDLAEYDKAFGGEGMAKAYFDAEKQKQKDKEDIDFATKLSHLPPGATVTRDGNTYTSTKEGKLTRVTEKAKDGTLTTVFYNEDGTVHNTSVIKPQGGGDGPQKFDSKAAQKEMELLLNQVKGEQGFISKEDWATALGQWTQHGGSRNDFVKAFRKYANPAAGYDYEGLPPVKGKPAK